MCYVECGKKYVCMELKPSPKIIRNKQQNNESSFATFVNFEKAFDWVNLVLLLYKLLLNNVDGKMYKAIKT